jgi:hypothetical protein
MRHAGKSPARASNGGAGYAGSKMIVKRMFAMAEVRRTLSSAKRAFWSSPLDWSTRPFATMGDGTAGEPTLPSNEWVGLAVSLGAARSCFRCRRETTAKRKWRSAWRLQPSTASLKNRAWRCDSRLIGRETADSANRSRCKFPIRASMRRGRSGIAIIGRATLNCNKTILAERTQNAGRIRVHRDMAV